MKSDGFPTYNFAHVVDDAEMEITHIIRGQEFLASIPNYLNLYEALELEAPIMATMPHILGPDGNKKLSKRDGAKDVLDYLREGYLEEALINFIASLGWNDGTEQEIFNRQELIDKFSLDRVGRSGARFDEKRLQWMNGQWIRNLSIDELYEKSDNFWPESAKNASEEIKKRVLALVQERLKYLGELGSMTSFLFETPVENLELLSGNKQINKLSSEQIKDILNHVVDKLNITEFKSENIQQALNELLEDTGQKPGVLFSLVRIITTWAQFSPSLPESLEILGKKETIYRLNSYLETL
jgi:glutamyl/glutaminyl-tRNA synthetase